MHRVIHIHVLYAYCFVCFSAYGDSLFMLIQTTIVAVLVLVYSNQIYTALVYVSVQSAVIWFLFLSGLASFDLIWTLQTANMPIIASSRVSHL